MTKYYSAYKDKPSSTRLLVFRLTNYYTPWLSLLHLLFIIHPKASGCIATAMCGLTSLIRAKIVSQIVHLFVNRDTGLRLSMYGTGSNLGIDE